MKQIIPITLLVLSCSQPIVPTQLIGDNVTINYQENFDKKARTILTNEGYVITLDKKWFNELETPVQEYILLHEMGHIEEGHFQRFDLSRLEEELQADCYAAKKISGRDNDLVTKFIRNNLIYGQGRKQEFKRCLK